jgi:SNF2 family DNA or RNA helicase
MSLDSNHPALIFSQWVGLLDIVADKLEGAGINYCRLDGSTVNRQAVVERFQSPTGPAVMLISLKAGGVGLTLHRAEHVYLLDPWWNPAAEEQATDRAHRIGQKNPVFVYRLITENTIEEQVMELQKRKLALAHEILVTNNEERNNHVIKGHEEIKEASNLNGDITQNMSWGLEEIKGLLGI